MLQIATLQRFKFWEHYSLIRVFFFYIRMFIIFIFWPLIGSAQDEHQFDEISVFLNIQRFGGTEIPSVIVNETVYLPIVDIFSFLKINNKPSAQLDSVTGSFINPQALYSIDNLHHRIRYLGKEYHLKNNDIIKTETNLYLKSTWFGQLFGLDCRFSFRNLSVNLSTNLELPVIREMRLEEMRANISRLKGEIKVDTTISRKFQAFHFGMADWSIISSQQYSGASDTRINLNLGTTIAGGEANALLNYDNTVQFAEKQQQYQWHYVNNDHPTLRQVTAGKISTNVTSSIFDPIVGVQITNTPTTYRRSFGTYTLSDLTEPNWIVELYVNNVLVDYTKADGSGFFKFEVPLVYGNTAVKLKYYGPWGEERTKEQSMSIPFNFLPPKDFEYNVSGGFIEDSIHSRFGRATLNYGVSRRLTIGGGIEYLSSVVKGTTMPFLSASIRVMNSLLFTGEYTNGVRAKGIINYRLPSKLQLEVDYTKYIPGQKAIIYNYLEERKGIISIPLAGKNFTAYTRLTVYQIVLPGLTNTNAEMLWSGSVHGVSTNFTTFGIFTGVAKPYLYSNLSLSLKLPQKFTLTPQFQYEYNQERFVSTRAVLEKPLFKHGYLDLSYEQNFASNIRILEVGFRYDFSFTQMGFSFRNANNQNTLIESAMGSLVYDYKSDYLGTTNRTNVGKGGITLLPFLDINGNGKRDKGEPKVAGLQFRINGGTIKRSDKDTTIHIFDLVPYTSYFLELDKNSFDNIAWQLHYLSMKVNIDANQFQTIEIPVSVVGEASGNVYLDSRGQGRILVCFYRLDGTLAGRVMTESDGYYSYLGLTPGKYTARIDPEQLKKLKMVSVPESIPINIAPSRDGTILDGLDFHLNLINKEPVKEPAKDTTKTVSKVITVVVATPAETPKTVAVTLTNQSLPTKTPSTIPTNQTVSIQAPLTTITSPPAVAPANPIIPVKAIPAPVKATPSIMVTTPVTVPTTPVITKPSQVSNVNTLPVTISNPKADVLNKVQELITNQPPVNKKDVQSSVQKADSTDQSKRQVAIKRFGSAIQAGAFTKEQNAVNVKEQLIKVTDNPVDILHEDGLYKVQIWGFKGRKEALEYLPKLKRKGFNAAFVVRID